MMIKKVVVYLLIEVPMDVIYMVSHFCFLTKVYNSNLVFWPEICIILHANVMKLKQCNIVWSMLSISIYQ